MTSAMRLALVLGLVVAAACGSRVDPDIPAPTTGPPTSAATTTTAAPSGGGDDALPIEEALELEAGSTVVVGGTVFVEGDEVRLCSALAESFPPQCGGPSLLVEGLDLSEFDLEEEQDVRWSETPVELQGTVTEGVLTVEP